MKIGILGGTFDPVHNGHLDMAYFCKEAFSLDRILFLPLGDAPHKEHITGKKLRAAMLQAALRGHADFALCDMELKRRGKTYTVDTLRRLKKQTHDEYYYIIGGDTAKALPTWKNAEEVFRLTEFLVIDRPGYDARRDAEKALAMGARLHFAQHTGLPVSSSQIRERVKEGQAIDALVPPGVTEVIEQYGLYQN